MTRLQLVSDTGNRLEQAPVSAGDRPERRTPRLYLVADTGSRYRAEPARKPSARNVGWLSLLVPMAAASASVLVAIRGYQQAMAGDAGWTAVPRIEAPSSPQTDPFAAPRAADVDVFGSD